MSIESFPEKNYKEILREVGPFNYAIFEKGQSLPGNFLPKNLPFVNYMPLVAGTGSTAGDYTFYEAQDRFTIPKGTTVILQRLLRYDDGHGLPHYNADDHVIFETVEGNIFRMKKDKAPDHFLKIVDSARLTPIAEAYHLPDEKTGPVEQFGKKGALLPIKIITQGKGE
jgi:hypothetical protein